MMPPSSDVMLLMESNIISKVVIRQKRARVHLSILLSPLVLFDTLASVQEDTAPEEHRRQRGSQRRDRHPRIHLRFEPLKLLRINCRASSSQLGGRLRISAIDSCDSFEFGHYAAQGEIVKSIETDACSSAWTSTVCARS